MFTVCMYSESVPDVRPRKDRPVNKVHNETEQVKEQLMELLKCFKRPVAQDFVKVSCIFLTNLG